MADLSSVISRVQSPTCTICREHHRKKQMAVQTPRSGIDTSRWMGLALWQLSDVTV